MKKVLLFFAIVISSQFFSQTCGYNKEQEKIEKQFPENRIRREQAEAKLLAMDVRAYLDKIGATSKNGQYTGTIYEIPVVIHVIESSAPSNSTLSLTDAQIQTWIDNANKMYATTYGNGFPAEGTSSLAGTVIPFKLVLAKRTPQCTSTTGIIRYTGSSITGYDAYGVQQDTANGATTAQIKALAPHWPENAYFNIYVVIGFDGNKTTWGLMGWCGYPTNSDAYYESFMKVTVITNTNDSTLVHEFGHGMGLDHPFKGANADPGNNPTAADCPANNDCTTDNDKVCDTEPTASLLSVYPTPTNSATNPCTGTNYAGVQYNIMNYTYTPNKFTPGQRDRALAIFMQYRGNLTNSLGGTDLASNPGAGSLVAASCSPSGINSPGNYGMGPIKVVLGTINNNSDSYNTVSNVYYADYSSQNCSTNSVYTDIPGDTASQLSISIGTNPQYVKAWIDYNNNGTFDSSELIGVSPSQVAVASSPYVITFTPPSTAIKNTYLRMRVIADWTNNTVCQNLSYGQAEDYSVRILNSTLAVNQANVEADLIIFSHSENKIILNSKNNSRFGAYKIFDISGKLIQSGKAETEIQLNTNIPKGTYIVNYGNASKKFIK